MLAFCDMRTLYLRNVPDTVVEGLEKLASAAGMSVSAYAVRELASVARSAENAALFASLPDLGIDNAHIVELIHEGRAER